MTNVGPLAGVRILELPGALGDYAGKQFADLGADVIIVEPPGGAPRRGAGPFIGAAEAAPEHSLSFAYFNTSKRGITLDLDARAGQDVFRQLVTRADVVLDGTGEVGGMRDRGLGPDDLLPLHPALVYTAVTAFGSDGPYADFHATDLILMAMGGLLSLGGYADGMPVRAFGDQACLAAAQFAAIGTLLAVLTAESTGQGQFVDVSAQQAVVAAHENAVQFYDLEGVVRRRNGGDVRQAAVGIYPCQDGHVYLLATGLGMFWFQLVDWLEAEGIEGATSLRAEKWQDNAFAASPDGKAEFQTIFDRLAMHRTKAQLYEAAKRARLPLCPVNTPGDLAASPQLHARDYFVDVPHPETGRTLRMPGAPFKMAASPWGVSRPAPRLGEHTADVLGALGMSNDELGRLAATGVI